MSNGNGSTSKISQTKNSGRTSAKRSRGRSKRPAIRLTETMSHFIDQTKDATPHYDACADYEPEHQDRAEARSMRLLTEIRPCDTVEAMLATQMVAVHNAAMDSFAHAVHAGEPELKNMHLTHARKLVGTFAQLAGILDRHRGSHGALLLPSLASGSKSKTTDDDTTETSRKSGSHPRSAPEERPPLIYGYEWGDGDLVD